MSNAHTSVIHATSMADDATGSAHIRDDTVREVMCRGGGHSRGLKWPGRLYEASTSRASLPHRHNKLVLGWRTRRMLHCTIVMADRQRRGGGIGRRRGTSRWTSRCDATHTCFDAQLGGAHQRGVKIWGSQFTEGCRTALPRPETGCSRSTQSLVSPRHACFSRRCGRHRRAGSRYLRGQGLSCIYHQSLSCGSSHIETG